MSFIKGISKWFLDAFRYFFQTKKMHGLISYYLPEEKRRQYEESLKRDDRK